MDKNTNSTEKKKEKSPILCAAGCGFFGSESFNNMCSKCYKSSTTTTTTTTAAAVVPSPQPSSLVNETPRNKLSTLSAPLIITPQDDLPPVIATSITTSATKRKHRTSSPPPLPRLSSPIIAQTQQQQQQEQEEQEKKEEEEEEEKKSASTSTTTTDLVQPPSEINSTASSPIASTTTTTCNEKPVQTNKRRCFKCRLKVPLAKQAANKCRCGYVFCDNHRYPDRHDCDIDYAKLDREILAKNNPKLHERPRGGRSFQRIDSL